jgi:hypothetical protein
VFDSSRPHVRLTTGPGFIRRRHVIMAEHSEVGRLESRVRTSALHCFRRFSVKLRAYIDFVPQASLHPKDKRSKCEGATTYQSHLYIQC